MNMSLGLNQGNFSSNSDFGIESHDQFHLSSHHHHQSWGGGGGGGSSSLGLGFPPSSEFGPADDSDYGFLGEE